MKTPLAGFRHSLVLAAALAVVASYSIEASADAVTCTASTQITMNNGLQRTDVTFGNNTADDCWGIGPQNGKSESTNPWHTGVWELLASDASPGDGTSVVGDANGVQFSLFAQNNGEWGLSWTDLGSHLPLTMDLVVVVATSSGFASYSFDDEVFGTAPNSRSGTFIISFGDRTTLDHFAVYRPQDVKLEARFAPQAIPEPAMLTLLGAGMIGLAVSRRRSRRPS